MPDNTDDKASNPPIINNAVAIHLNSTTVQDILADLGKPSRIFYKEEDKMKIHSVNDHGNLLYKSPHPIEAKTADTTADDKDKGLFFFFCY